MRIINSWTDGNSCFYEIELSKNRIVCAKKVVGSDDKTSFVYIMSNADGTMVRDREGNTYPDVVNEKAVVRYLRSQKI